MDIKNMNLEEVITKLHRYCLSLTTSKWYAEDLVQETLMKYIEILEKEPQRDINITFLYTVARNLFIDEKRRKNEVFITGQDYYQGSNDFTEWDSALEILYSTLPIRQAMLVTLKDVFLYSSKEIAQMLRISNESVKTALHRARIKLKKKALEQTVNKNVKYSSLIEELFHSIKNAQPHQIFYYYRLLETGNYQVSCRRTLGELIIFASDPDGNMLQIHQKKVLPKKYELEKDERRVQKWDILI